MGKVIIFKNKHYLNIHKTAIKLKYNHQINWKCTMVRDLHYIYHDFKQTKGLVKVSREL